MRNNDEVPAAFKWAEYASIFKYSFQAMVKNEYDDLDLDCVVYVSETETEPCDPVGDLKIEETLWESILYLAIIMIAYRIIAFTSLKLLSRRHTQS